MTAETGPFVGIFGKANQREGDINLKIVPLCYQLAECLASYRETIPTLSLVFGGGSGYPYELSRRAKEIGIPVHAFPPVENNSQADSLSASNPGFINSEQLNVSTNYVVFLTTENSRDGNQLGLGKPFSEVTQEEQKARNVRRSQLMNDWVKQHDGVVLVIGGGVGTKRELIDALNKGIPVGILLGTGGITEGLEDPNGWNIFTQELSEKITGVNIQNLLFKAETPELLTTLAISQLPVAKVS